VTFPADRQIATRLGMLDVAVTVLPDGRCIARIVSDYPDLAGMAGAIGETEDEAVARLAAMIGAG
jgi:hypothetical protein